MATQLWTTQVATEGLAETDASEARTSGVAAEGLGETESSQAQMSWIGVELLSPNPHVATTAVCVEVLLPSQATPPPCPLRMFTSQIVVEVLAKKSIPASAPGEAERASGSRNVPIKLEEQRYVPLDPIADEEIKRIYRNLHTIFDRPPVVEWLPIQRDQVPVGYHILDGHAISRTENPVLWKYYGVQHGEGDGQTTFNLPDFTDKVPIGAKVGKISGYAEPLFEAGVTGKSVAYYLPITRAQ